MNKENSLPESIKRLIQIPSLGRIYQKIDLPMQILFYPISLSGSRISGVGIGDHIPSQTYIVDITNFYLLKFFTPEVFFFQIGSKQLDFFKKDERRRCSVFGFLNGEFESYPDFNSKNQFHKYVDDYTKKPNSLKHIITKSRRISDRERKCISLAIDFGFPLINIINFRKNTMLRFRDRILEEWGKIITSQSGRLENDFMHTLKRGARTIKKEYSNLFIELDGISGEDPLPPAEPLFSFMNILSDIDLLPQFSPPKIFFDQVSIKAIFDLTRECTNAYSRALSSEFEKRKCLAEVEYNTINRSKKKDRYRTRFLINLTFPEYMELSHARWELSGLRDIILSELKKTDPEAYEIFRRSKLEIWLKKVGVNIVIQKNFEKETISLIREFFKGTLDYGSILSQPISTNLVRIRFGLSFDKMTDYSISEIDIYYGISDRYTRLAIEKMYRGEFSEASRYLKRAKNALLGDLYTIRSRETENGSKKLLKKALDCYRKAGVGNSIIFEGYLDTKSKDRVLTALEVNSDWMISLRLYLKARDLEKDILYKKSLKTEGLESELWLEGLYKRYSGLNLEKRLDSFIEKIGNFYSILLVELQRKHQIPSRRILGF